MTYGFTPYPWLTVFGVSILHFTYAVGYLIDHEVAHITALHIAYVIFGSLLWLVMIMVGVIALLPTIVKPPTYLTHFCLWPQCAMLFLMVLSAFEAAYLGSYPDGTIKQNVFILIDQSYTFVLFGMHYFATVQYALSRRLDTT